MKNIIHISFLNPDDYKVSEWIEALARETKKGLTIDFVPFESMPQDGRNILFVSGGDGSLNHSINELMVRGLNHKVEIMYFPSGTGNDFSRVIGLYKKSKQEIIALLHSGKSAEMRVGKIDEKYFINMASCGMFAQITPEVNPHLKGLFGRWSYYFKGFELLTDIQTTHCEFTINNEVFDEVDCVGFFVANGRFSGGGVQITPYASPFKDTLELLIVRKAPIPRLISLGLELQKSQPDISEFDTIHKKVESFQFTSRSPISMSIDGEKLCQISGKFRLSQGHIKFLTP